jgi:predicted NAD-dependent protein-ADP-ribosyltransferase YbiA (DUF1768 family)
MASKTKLKSKIDKTKQVEYYELRTLNQDDIKYETTIYETDILGKTVAICLGRANYLFQYKNIVYFPIYLMRGDVIRSQIGVYEIYLDNLIEYSHNGSVDHEQVIAKNAPLLYSFANEDYIIASNSSAVTKTQELIAASSQIIPLGTESKEEEKESKATDLLFKPKVAPDTYDIFEFDKSAHIPEMLKEEMKPDNTPFNDTPSASWIQKFMESYDYRIISIPGDGDCFFTSVMKAYAQIGKRTTVDILRRVVADSANADVFQSYSNLYHMYITEEAELESNIEKTAKMITDLRRRYKNIPETKKEERQTVYAEIVALNKKQQTYKLDLATATKNKNEYIFMENVDSLKDMRVAMRDSKYWADEIAISALENALNIKFIILSNGSYKMGDEDAVLKCQTSVSKNDSRVINPDHYIMLSYTGNHYELISYKNKSIFEFTEIPYKVKALIVNKCIEKNDGTFGLIKDFINFQERLGIEVEPEVHTLPSQNVQDIDDSTVFMFHKTSAHEKPGKGSGETIKPENISKYAELARIKDWRRLLADEATTPFKLDGKSWQTVEHYYQGSQFKKGFPDFYKLFSLDSDHEISKDVDKAIAAGSKTGMYKKTLMRPKTTKPDPDFFTNGRNNVERATALLAKFQTNAEARRVLVLTHDAVLKQFVRGTPAEPDELLMEVRSKVHM